MGTGDRCSHAGVAAYRQDQIEAAPQRWSEVVELARDGRVAFALIPINALMTFFGLARNMEYDIAVDPGVLIERGHGRQILELMKEIVGLIDERCLSLDPIGILEWMSRTAEGPCLRAFRLRLYELQPPGVLPVSHHLRRCAGDRRKRSARNGHRWHRDCRFRLLSQ